MGWALSHLNESGKQQENKARNSGFTIHCSQFLLLLIGSTVLGYGYFPSFGIKQHSRFYSQSCFIFFPFLLNQLLSILNSDTWTSCAYVDLGDNHCRRFFSCAPSTEPSAQPVSPAHQPASTRAPGRGKRALRLRWGPHVIMRRACRMLESAILIAIIDVAVSQCQTHNLMLVIVDP